MQGDLAGDGTHTYQWDAEGRLKSVDNGTTATYTYNALGWRVEKLAAGVYTEYLFGASGERLGENNRSAWTESYVPLGYGHYAIYQNNATYFTHPNALGSTTMVTDYDGNVVQDNLFYPWGQDWQTVGSVYDERFAKLQRRDTETSLDLTANRMFASGEGRWLTPDRYPADVKNPQTFNRYAYVINNPTTLADPTGLHFFSPCYSLSNCTWGGDPNLGGGGGCTVDGISGPCPTLTSGYFTCPASPCAGWATNSAGQRAYFQIIADANGNFGWLQLTGWTSLATAQDPGCGPSVVAGINAGVGADYGLTFSQKDPGASGTEKGGNWDYTLVSNSVGSEAAAQDIANQINNAPGLGSGTRSGGAPSSHAPNASWANLGTMAAADWVVELNGAHNDTINANIPVVGWIGHGGIDVLFGNYIQGLGGSLGCH